LECSSIKVIIQRVNDVVNTIRKKEYYPNIISVFYSHPFGEEQDLRFDDFRSNDIIKKEGPMIRSIVSLMNDVYKSFGM